MSEHERILLLAHGSSDSHWCDTFEQLAAPTLKAHPTASIAYMELAEPSLEQEGERLSAEGATQVSVIPLFLAAGRHLRKDVPEMIEGLEKKFSVHIRLLRPIGEDPELGEAIERVVGRIRREANE